MTEMTVKAMLTFAAYSFLLVTVSLLASCSAPAKYLFECGVVNPTSAGCN